MTTPALEGPVAPEPIDELAALLGAVPYFSPAERHVDDAYTLPTALAEVDAWLHGSLTHRETKSDHTSLLEDFSIALGQRGQHIKELTPAFEGLYREVATLVPRRGQRRDRAQALAVLNNLQEALSSADASVAGFDDLFEAVEDPTSSRQLVDARLSIFCYLIRTSGRPVAQICRRLSSVLQNQKYAVDLALHHLDGKDVPAFEQADHDAGLATQDRLHLSRRLLQTPDLPSTHVVWLGYQNARVTPFWRQKVGSIEFFDGPTLLGAIQDPEMSSTPLPDELRLLTGEFEVSRGLSPWPRDIQVWAAARIEIESGHHSNPVEIALSRVNAVIQMATFNRQVSTWRLLEGHIHFQDGRQGSSEALHPVWPDDELRARTDATADEFEGLDQLLGAKLRDLDRPLRRLVTYATDLNTSMRSPGPNLILGDIRAMEFVARQIGSPDWLDLMIGKTAVSHAWNRAVNEIKVAVRNARSDYTLDLVAYEGKDAIESRVGDWSASDALDVLPQFIRRGPTHHRSMRRLRDLERRTTDRESVRTWIDELKSEYEQRLKRAERFRNALTHGDEGTAEVALTISILVNMKARNVIRLALEAVLEGRPISATLDTWREEFRAWERALRSAGTAHEALFAEHRSAETRHKLSSEIQAQANR